MLTRTQTLTTLVALSISTASCGDPPHQQAPEAMAVQRVFPDAAVGRNEPLLFLNQEISIYFSQPVDPLSVTSDTVRVVDENGNRVDGRLRVGTRSVAFEPIPPIRATLDDGSFRPDHAYRLEITGLPLWNAVRSQDGARLAERFRKSFRAVAADPTAAGFATPFLPVGKADDPFALREDLGLHLAADTGRLLLHFNLPVLPMSATPDAVKVGAMRGGQSRELRPTALRIVAERRSYDSHYGSTVEVSVDPGEVDPGALHFVSFPSDATGLRDYLGRPLAGAEWLRNVSVEPGGRVRVLQLGGRAGWRLSAERPPDELPLTSADAGPLEPTCRVEAGDGSLGVLQPKRDTTIRPGEAFDRGDGASVRADGDFRFRAIDVPAGVTLTVHSSERVTLRSMGSIRIAGRLILDTPIAAVTVSSGDRVELDSLLRASWLTLIGGGDVQVTGVVEHRHAHERGSPFAIIASGDFDLSGVLPAEVVVNNRSPMLGTLESPIWIDCALTHGLPAGTTARATALTQWIRLPADCIGPVEAVLDGVRGAVTVSIQSAPAHSVDATRPDLAADRVSPLVAAGTGIAVGAGAFVRFRIEMAVEAGTALPSLGGIRVFDRGR